jgi:hypothetical protein
MQDYIFILYFTSHVYGTWSRHPKGRTSFEGDTEQSAGENICTYERGSKRRLKETA